MKKYLVPIIAVTIGVVGYLLYQRGLLSPSSASVNSGSDLTTVDQSKLNEKEYTLEEVSKHVSETDCWSAINGKVYDITKMIPVHKGGKEKIMSICGKDGTVGFSAMHGSNSKVLGLISSMQIGQIK